MVSLALRAIHLLVARFPVILSDPKQSEGESKNLRTIDSAKILRLRAPHSAQDDIRLDGGAVRNSVGDDHQPKPPMPKGGLWLAHRRAGGIQVTGALEYVGATTGRPLPCHSERPEAKRRGVEESTQCR